MAITDEELDAWAANPGSKGYYNAEPHLRPLDPEQRSLAVAEAHIRMATSPGWNFSGAVWHGSKDVARGETPMADLSRSLMAQEA